SYGPHRDLHSFPTRRSSDLRGFEIIGISLDDEPAKVEGFIAQKGISWPQICDGKADAGAIPKLYNVNGTPDLYVIDRAGNIAARDRKSTRLNSSHLVISYAV